MLVDQPVGLTPLVYVRRVGTALVNLRDRQRVGVRANLPFLNAFNDGSGRAVNDLYAVGEDKDNVLRCLGKFCVVKEGSEQSILANRRAIGSVGQKVNVVSRE